MKEPIKLKINLENMPHSVFRRVLVPEDLNMMQLHAIIQIAMGWNFAHLFQFMDSRNNPTIKVTDNDEDAGNDLPLFFRGPKSVFAEEVTLKNEFLLNREGKSFWYLYDFGDDWYHKISFQKPTKKDLALFTGAPVCIEAFGACPPEDVGGPWGYAHFLLATEDKKHPQHRKLKEWAGLSAREKYDPEYVDIENINENLLSLFQSPDWR